MTRTLMMNNPFIFVDGWTFYANNGNKTKIFKKDLKEAKKKGMTEAEIKSMAFSYLTDPKVIYTDNIIDNVYRDNEF